MKTTATSDTTDTTDTTDTLDTTRSVVQYEHGDSWKPGSVWHRARLDFHWYDTYAHCLDWCACQDGATASMGVVCSSVNSFRLYHAGLHLCGTANAWRGAVFVYHGPSLCFALL